MFFFRARFITLLCASLTLLGTLLMPTGASAQGNSEAAVFCQGGGYLNYTDAAGKVFKNSGQCVSFFAQGNAVDPVEDARLSIEFGQDLNGDFMVLSGSGLKSGSQVTSGFTDQDGIPVYSDFVIGHADGNGNFLSDKIYIDCEEMGTVTLSGVGTYGTRVSITEQVPC